MTSIGASISDPNPYTISSTSNAKGKGTSLTEVTADKVFACYANPPSDGAYEAQ